MALGDSAGLLFKITADGDQAVREINRVEGQIKGSTGAAGSSLASLAGPAAIAGAAIAAIGAAAVTAANTLFQLSKNTAEFGSQIFDASQKTGLSAETLSALKFAADQSGSSFEQLTAGVTRFGVEVGKAAQGNDKAVEKMRNLGVTSTDMRTALEQAVKTIFDAKTETDRLALAQEAFGRKIGPDLIPLIKDAGGNLDELERKAKELGVTIDDKAAAAADEFGDQLDLLSSQLAGVGRSIGSAFMPIFLEMSRNMSDWLVRNKAQIAAWADTFAGAMQRAVREMETVNKWISDHPTVWGVIKQGVYGALTGDYTGTSTLPQGYAPGSTPMPGTTAPTTTTPPDRGAGFESDADRAEAARRAEEFRTRQLAGQLQYLDALQAGDLDYLKRNRDEWEKAFADRIVSAEQFKDAALENERRFRVKALEDVDKELGLRLQKEGLTQAEILALKKEAENEKQKIIDESFRREDDAANKVAEQQKRITAEQRKESEERKRIIRDETQTVIDAARQKTQTLISEFELMKAKGLITEQQYAEAVGELRVRQLELERAMTDDAIQRAAIDEQIKQQKNQNAVESIEATERESEAYDRYREAVWKAQMAQAELNARQREMVEQSGPVTQVMTSLANMLGRAFQQVANAVGSVVQQWVLYGKTGPAVMRQILAQALASIAAEAAVRAIYELAAGFAALFLNPGEAAAHFTAAALYGSIAGVAAIAGRAVAGNTFNREAQTATGRGDSTAGSTSGQRNTEGQGQVYSKYGDDPMVIETGRNAPRQAGLIERIAIDLRLKGEGLADLIEANVKRGGRLRELIIDTSARGT